MNNLTKIQLIGDVTGYLDVAEDIVVPINYSVGDIRDISKRSGSFSKTIILPGTKNNNSLLNDYFEVNVLDGTFNINKIQQCILLQNNIPIMSNTYLQLVSVKKQQNNNCGDDLVQYEIVIKDNVGDFFTQINNKELTDVDLSVYNHTLTASNIISSFTNTEVDGYKYVIPWSSSNSYKLNECKPAIYAKAYWDRIHSLSGYSYEWNSLVDNNVRFDKLLIPFNGDETKLTEEIANENKVIADRTNHPDFEYIGFNQVISGIKTSITRSINPTRLFITNELQDPNNDYNPITSIYTSPYFVTNPNALDFIFEIDYDIILDNNGTTPVTVTGASRGEYRTAITVANLNASIQNIYTKAYIDNGYSPSQLYAVFPIGETSLLNATANITISKSNINQLDNIVFAASLEDKNLSTAWKSTAGPTIQPQVSIKLRINYIKVSIKLNSESLIFNSPVNLNSFIPKKIKQSDFVKSIMTMYNLFVEVDPDDPNKLIYTQRDEFYDNGSVVDWTDKLAKDKQQEVKFLPEITSKKLILTYKQDETDSANKIYLEATNEIYGQQEVIFQNNYVKGIDKKEIIFSPTPSQPTQFNAILPLIQGSSPKNNIRILLDNGQESCQSYTIENYQGNIVSSSVYPFVSHLDKAYNPTFDINFGICDFYFYDIVNYTSNNLYNNFWRRTMAQLDQGKLMVAYFYLKESDINKMRLNDKIRIDNSYWNINKIIDYDANGRQLTKVELLSIDDDLKLPAFGKRSRIIKPGTLPTLDDSIYPTKAIRSLQFVLEQLNIEKNLRTSVSNSIKSFINLGTNNSIDGDFNGIIIGDNIHAAEDGIYLGNIFIDKNGNIKTSNNSIIIDCGEDIVLNLNRTNLIEIIDGGENSIRKFGGTSNARPIIDGGKF